MDAVGRKFFVLLIYINEKADRHTREKLQPAEPFLSTFKRQK